MKIIRAQNVSFILFLVQLLRLPFSTFFSQTYISLAKILAKKKAWNILILSEIYKKMHFLWIPLLYIMKIVSIEQAPELEGFKKPKQTQIEAELCKQKHVMSFSHLRKCHIGTCICYKYRYILYTARQSFGVHKFTAQKSPHILATKLTRNCPIKSPELASQLRD